MIACASSIVERKQKMWQMRWQKMVLFPALPVLALFLFATSRNEINPLSPHNIVCTREPAAHFDRRARNGTLTFATFNAEWLFDGVNDRLAPWRSESDAARHVDRVARAVMATDADVIALVESEGCFMLHRVIAAMAAQNSKRQCSANGADTAGQHEAFLVGSKDTSTRQQLGLLTRVSPQQPLRHDTTRLHFPVPGSSCGAHRIRRKTSGVSKHFWTVLSVGGEDILLVAAHLKAAPNKPRACAQREAQARVLAGLVRREGYESGRHVLLMGDFNDFDGNSTTVDVSGNMPRSDVLRTLTQDLGLSQASSRLPRAERWTWRDTKRQGGVGPAVEVLHKPRYPRAALDHVLLSEGLVRRLKSVHVERNVPGASDHFPLVVQLAL